MTCIFKKVPVVFNKSLVDLENCTSFLKTTCDLLNSTCEIDLLKLLARHMYTTRFFSSKVKFIYTSTVTRSHSCYGKNYAYASRTSCFKCYNICDMSCIYGRYKNLILFTLF